MRSFIPRTSPLKTTALAAMLMAVPLAGAYAAQHSPRAHRVVTFDDARLDNLLAQVQGLDEGVSDASLLKLMKPAVAHDLHMQAASITRDAERAAARDHGMLPTESYNQLMRRLDNLAEARLIDSGSGLNFGDGADGGSYPNG